ncbi:biotin--[acetyl-CoA-carboxylase] ligase [Verrucomicrobiaceae bacterium N1E253]|uniref:Biotin--[acetyl-CoA-carboxylase] ligase n=1 Tax=Oceaniferula marina TaxID=2748318 RepID=A0A851GB46_9BACT|nr:biotin--[acetyl-CoA-carboxylase] ligase [Oceaniferula marina]NWK54833.1 biotin--[acetyl-CoA-carboxylase] ligase [Oceaniferula marina]
MFDLGELHRLAPRWSRLVHHYEQLESTNDTARDLAVQGADHGTVVLADLQHSGRGRRGAVWASAPGEGLLFSLILRPDYSRRYWSRLALAAGLGMVDSLRSAWGIEASIKWPNDVYIQGRKCAGILVESQDGFAVVGIGLNVSSSPEGGDSTSLHEQVGVEVSREEVLVSVLDAVLQESKGCADQFASQVVRMRSYCWLTGKDVSFVSNGEKIHGHVTGIGNEGDLMVRVAGVERSYQQAELIRVV